MQLKKKFEIKKHNVCCHPTLSVFNIKKRIPAQQKKCEHIYKM